jgi:PAS domain-containing protein
VTEPTKDEQAPARLAAIVESSDDAIVSKTVDGIITSWNHAAERLFGYAAAEVIGQHITLIIPPDRLDEENTVLASIRAGHRIEHFETVRVTKEPLLDHLIGPLQERRRDRQAEGFGGFEVDDQFDLGRLLDWQVGGFGALQDLVDEDGSTPLEIRGI